MPTIYELFGFSVQDRSELAERTRRSASCPFMEARCDGGGNRNQTKIHLSDKEPELSQFFDKEINAVIPGICSIIAGEDTWVVCPRRLFAARNTDNVVPVVNRGFQTHERDILLQTELPRDMDIGVWSEVYVKQKIDDAEINYHFDYVAVPLISVSLREFLRQFHLTSDQLNGEILSFAQHMKKKGYYPRGTKDVSDLVIRLPDMERPYIFEVMTASTSGSDTEDETDIRSAFRNAILSKNHESPGINKRQVWGRMVTQLFAKTALAHFWGGQTLWIIQDELLRNIELTTLLKTSRIARKDGSDINLIVMHYKNQKNGSRAISLKGALTGASGLEFRGDDTFTDILLPKVTPPKIELARAMLRRSIDAIMNL
jgi:hypothetical protein